MGTPLPESETEGFDRRHWRPRSRAELERVLAIGYGLLVDLESRMGALRVVANALSAGERPRAAIALLHARLPALPDLAAARRMAEADPLAKYSPLQPRVPKGQPGGGQWTSEGGSADGTSAAASPVTPAQATIVESFVEPFEMIRPLPFPGEISPPTEITPLPHAPVPPLENPYPDDEDCVEEWAHARAFCERLRSRGLLGKEPYRNMVRTYAQ
jgi:hypothetical protein